MILCEASVLHVGRETLVLESAGDVEPWIEQWDALAVDAGRPYAAPGWLLPWWEHMRPRDTDAAMRIVLAVDGASLLAVAPFFVERGPGGRRDVRLIGSGSSHGLEILGPAADEATARSLARALAELEPSLVSFEGVAEASPWLEAIRSRWPAALRPQLLTTGRQLAPIVTLDPDYERWLGGRSRNFRQQLTQAKRRLEKAGSGVFLATTAKDRDDAIGAFARLHPQRWAERGGSNLSTEDVSAMLRAAASHLEPDRLRLFALQMDGEIAAVQILVAAGTNVCYWNGGWDERHANLRPGLVTLVAAIEDASRRGDRRLDLGGGADRYKLRVADLPVDSAVTTRVLVPLAQRYPYTRLTLLPQQLRHATVRGLAWLPAARERQVRGWIRRVRSARRN